LVAQFWFFGFLVLLNQT